MFSKEGPNLNNPDVTKSPKVTPKRYSGSPTDLIKKHGRINLEEVFLELVRNKNELY